MVTTTLRYASSAVEADDSAGPSLQGLVTSCTATCLFRPQSWPGADLVQASRTKKRKVPSNPEVLGPSRSWRPAQAAPAILSLRRSQAPNILSLAKDIDHGEDAFEPDEHDEAQPGTQEE